MPHKRTKAVGKLLFFNKKTTPRSIDRFGLKTIILNNSNEGEVYKIIFVKLEFVKKYTVNDI